MIAQEILSEIDFTIDKLIINAKEMNKASKVNITKEEIDVFQNKQEELIAHLIRMDSDYKTRHSEVKKPHLNSAANKIRKKLRQFETLNDEFINNTTNELNIIRFNERKNLKSIRTKRKSTFSKTKVNKN